MLLLLLLLQSLLQRMRFATAGLSNQKIKSMSKSKIKIQDANG